MRRVHVASSSVLFAVMVLQVKCYMHNQGGQGGQVRDLSLEDATVSTLHQDILLDTEAPEDERPDAVDSARVALAAAELQRVEYKLEVTTGTEENADTKSAVYATVHGTDGDTEEFSLTPSDSPDNPFKRGGIATIRKSLKDVGKITKIRLRNPSEDDWLCKDVRVVKTETTTDFKVDKWVVSPQQTTRWAYPEVEYILMVATGAEKTAGTEKPQMITIYGLEGSTGEVELGEKFEADTTVPVTLKARDVGEPTFVALHNPSDDEWYCESIKMTTSYGSSAFSVAKWVSSPLHPKANIPVDKNYLVVVNTPYGFDDGTQGQINIQLFGTSGASRIHPLTKGIHRGQNTSAEVSAKDVGTITKIILSTDSEDGWHCNYVNILYDNMQRSAHFDVHAWIQAPISQSLSVLADISYAVSLTTGDENDAGSTGEFSIIMYGNLGITRALALPTDGFKNSSVSSFTLTAKDIGELTKVRLSTRSSDNWKCKDITITKQGKAYPFSVDKWVEFPLAAAVDTNVDIKYAFSIVTGNHTDASTTAMIYITLYGTRGESRNLPLKTGFSAGSFEAVTFKTQDVGFLTRIKLASNSTDQWYCSSVNVHYDSDTVNFHVRKWVGLPDSSEVHINRQ